MRKTHYTYRQHIPLITITSKSLTLNPKPVRKRDHRAQPQRRPKPHRPRRTQQQQIHQQKPRRRRMKAQIRRQRQLQLRRHHERRVDEPQSPVERADQTLERRGADGEDILEAEERGRAGEVGEEAGGEGQQGDEQADDGEVLEVPAVGGGDGIWVLEEPVERVEEGGEAEELEWVSGACVEGE